MPDTSRLRLKLRGKLTLTYLGVGLALTSINVWSTRWLQQRTEEVAAGRDETVRLAEELAAVNSSAFEEGFGYVLSGEPAERAAYLYKMEQLKTLRKRLIDRWDVQGERADVPARLDESMKMAVAGAHRMFEKYDREGRVDRSSLEAYELSMDQLSDLVRHLATNVRQQAESDNGAARHRLDRVLLAIGAMAALLAVSMGALFGLHLTRPLVRLRVAAVRLGRGELEFEFGERSRDEFGEVTDAFGDMAANIRRLLLTVADQARRLEEVFASLGEMLLVCAPDGAINSVNRSVSATLGYSEEEMVGKRLDTMLDTVTFDDLRRQAVDRDARGALGTVGVDLRMRCKDGRHVVVCVSASLLRTNTRDYAGIICVAQDLSDRRRLEAELRQAQKLQAIGQLASGVAHEINTPVQFVSDSVHFARDAAKDLARVIQEYQSSARAIEEGGMPATEAFAPAHAIEIESDLPYLLEKLPGALDRSILGLDRISTIVRSMKVFAHPGQARMVAVDLNQSVESTLVVALGEYKYVAELETHFGELPPVMCHAGEINQAVLNLVVNAAHAVADNPNQETKGRITVRTYREDDSVVISVSDTGTGIPMGIRDRIFDPFFTTKEVGKGTGQGLSVARAAIVEKHRGQLTFETECGKGTTFRIRLPIRGAEAPPNIPSVTTAAA